MSHPAPESLTTFALGANDPAVERHLGSCATCQADLARLREVTGTLRDGVALRPAAATAACLDEFTLAEFVLGRLSDAERQRAVEHLAVCAHCRSESRAAGAVLADVDVMREASRTGRVAAGASAGRRWMLPVGAAAAAALVLLLWSREPDPVTRLRENPVPVAGAPRAIAPVATVSNVDSLTWSSVPSAELYRVRLHDADGQVVWRAETSDTSVALPDSVRLRSGVRYLWKVEAQTAWRRWSGSSFIEFELRAP